MEDRYTEDRSSEVFWWQLSILYQMARDISEIFTTGEWKNLLMSQKDLFLVSLFVFGWKEGEIEEGTFENI